MTAKQFFKSTAFRALAVLLAITIVAGGLLAIFNDLLYITDEERFNRVIEEIYGGNAKVEKTILSTDDEAMTFDNGTVSQVYLMDDGNYLIQATGKNGYNGGTVTVWVVHNFERSSWKGIGKVVYESNTSQTQMGTFSSSYYELFTQYNDEILDDMLFSAEGEANTVPALVAGSSRTSRAFCNAVNTSILYVKSELLGQEVVTYKYEYEKYIDMDNSVIEADLATKTLNLSLTVKANGEAGAFVIDITVKNGTITAYEIKTNGSTDGYEGDMNADYLDGTFFLEKDAAAIKAILDGSDVSLDGGTITSGASYSNFSCLIAAAFATANFDDLCTAEFLPYADYIDFEKSSVETDIEADTVKFSLNVKSNGDANAFVIEITVTGDTITSYEIKTNGSTDGYEGDMNADYLNGTAFTNKTAADLKAILEGDDVDMGSGTITSGASYSNFSCLIAAVYAATNANAFRTAEYLPYAEHFDSIITSTEGTSVYYTLTVKSNGDADAFVIDVTVTDGAIADFEIKTNGSTGGYEGDMNPGYLDGTAFVGKTAADLKAVLEGDDVDVDGGTITSGASYSDFSCLIAAVYAASNYPAFVAEGGEQ